jgi:hypothetical protein
MAAACAAATKRMPTKNLEMNMAMLVAVVCVLVFQLGGRCPRKKSVLTFISVLSFPASTRSHNPPPPIASSQAFQLFSPLSRSMRGPSFTPFLCFLRCSAPRTPPLGTQFPAASPIMYPRTLIDVCANIRGDSHRSFERTHLIHDSEA